MAEQPYFCPIIVVSEYVFVHYFGYGSLLHFL